MANRTINLKDEAIRKLEERLQRLEMKKPRSSNSINEKRHSPRLSSRGSSNDHGREEEHRRRRHHHHFHGYRPHAHGERHNREDAYHQEAKPKISFIKVPSFSGDSDRNVYLDWEAKCEQIFDVHEVHEDHKVMITSLEFIDYAMKWWHSVVKDIIYNKGRPVDSWNTLKQRMRLRFVPPHFRKDLMLKLQRFQQGALCVDSYYKVLKTLLLKVDMHESEEAMIARFVNGLRKDIQDIFELQEYSSLGSLVHLAVMVEAQLAKKNAFKNAPNDDSSFKPKESKPSTSIPKSPIKSSSKKCFKCMGYSHIAANCPSKRNMFVHNGIVMSEHDSDSTRHSSHSRSSSEHVSESQLEGDLHEVQRDIVAHNPIFLVIPRPLKLEPLVDSPHCLDNLVKEFQDVFQDPPKGLPPLRGIEHQIDLILGSSLPNRPAYKTNPSETKEIRQQVNDLIAKGWVQDSMSPCAMPIILVPKKDGTWRMCLDCRAVNNITIKYRHPIPRLDDLLDELHGLQNSLSNSLQIGEYDGDQAQKEIEVEDQ
ncbi:uncharacterized protein [Phaseolus vulgaris]|uniref:uncharacterized protein n=1 Tax=Phaseolus vulgaris TaxID=3885 RepID=UPI0035CB5709